MALNVKVIELLPQAAVVVKYKASVAEMGERMPEMFGRLMNLLQRKNIEPAGMPFSLYPSTDADIDGRWRVINGIPINDPIELEEGFEKYTIPGGHVAVGTHIGSYEELEKTYNEMLDWIKSHEMSPGEMMWEYYFTDPQEEPDPLKWRTDVYWPVQKVRLAA